VLLYDCGTLLNFQESCSTWEEPAQVHQTLTRSFGTVVGSVLPRTAS
jgi:hypothetical protein